MTKEEAIIEMKAGYKVTHLNFDDGEFIRMVLPDHRCDIIQDEECNTYSFDLFWKERIGTGTSWNEGWDIYED